jgi:hypothetical protein
MTNLFGKYLDFSHFDLTFFRPKINLEKDEK